LDTAQAQKRIAFARKIGADVIQIALPFWLELDDDEVVAFFEAVAEAAGPTPIVHYDTGRAKRRISPALYQRIRKRVPTVWGTKFGGDSIWSVKCITRANPTLKVFVGEMILASATPMGATGSYSAFVNVNSKWMLDYYEACRTRDWARAFQRQEEAGILLLGLDELATPNLQDTALDRILGQLAGFLKCPLEGKPPYRSGTKEDLRRWRAWVKDRAPRLLELQ
jgi:dihydrodipicolinate synthase/N-acetylneuraminate lyase